MIFVVFLWMFLFSLCGVFEREEGEKKEEKTLWRIPTLLLSFHLREKNFRVMKEKTIQIVLVNVYNNNHNNNEKNKKINLNIFEQNSTQKKKKKKKK